MSAKAETGNLPDVATTATIAAQNIDQISEPTATSAVKPDAETTASNKKIDSITWSEVTEAAEPVASEPTANLQVSIAAPEKSEAATSEIAETETAQNTSIAAETENSEETAKIADNGVEVQSTVETAKKSDRPTSIVAESNNLEVTATKEEKEVQTAQELLSNPVSTSASALTNQPKVAEKPATLSEPTETASEPTEKVAQGTQIRPGRATRSGPSYVGIGGNVGFGGDSALGDGSFAIISKIGLTNNLSVRPTVLFRDNLTLVVPVTFDFVSQETVEVSEDFVISAAPYAGAGVIVTTGDDGNFGFLISGGVDVPLTRNLTATAGLNIGFVDGADVGLLVGVGYTFPNLAR
ncbi:hypothetical protein QUA62_02935 [Microcoleus sp. MON1_C1]|uniref:hypothetical protein n=1 Tax=Microcoleus sp. MON1_C1 TaxID=2818827 RepID=UPI002FD3C5CD